MSSTPLYGHWWPLATYSCHCLFPCHNHVLIAYNEPFSKNYRFLWVNMILLLKKETPIKIACKFDFDKAVSLHIGPCMVWAHFKMPVTSHSTPQPPKGMWKGKDVDLGAGIITVKICWVPPGDKVPVTSHSTPQPPKGMWKGKDVDLGAGIITVKICWVPPGDKVPATNHSNL